MPAGANPDQAPRQLIPAAGGLHGRADGKLWQRGAKTLMMGILNVTPDSFSDGGDPFTTECAVAGAEEISLWDE